MKLTLAISRAFLFLNGVISFSYKSTLELHTSVHTRTTFSVIWLVLWKYPTYSVVVCIGTADFLRWKICSV